MGNSQARSPQLIRVNATGMNMHRLKPHNDLVLFNPTPVTKQSAHPRPGLLVRRESPGETPAAVRIRRRNKKVISGGWLRN